MQGDNAFSHRSDLLSQFLHAEAEEAKEALDSSGLGDGVPEPRVATKKEILADEFLRDMLISFLQAGRDTSAVTLSWFFWLLDCNPRVEEAIYEEISRVHHKSSLPPEDKPESREVNGILSFEQLKDIHYLQAALTECVRIYAPVPPNVKVAMADDVWPDGTRIRKKHFGSIPALRNGKIEETAGFRLPGI
jgi:cytochrome P450